MNTKSELYAKGGIVLCLLLIAFVLHDWLVGAIEKLYPLTSVVANENLLVQSSLVVVIGLIYALQWKSLTYPRNNPGQRFLLIFALLSLYLLFRFDERIRFYHLPKCRISYLGICFIIVFIFELVVFICRMRRAKQPAIKFQTNAHQFFYDAPAKIDSLQRSNHAKVLVDQISATLSQEGMETSFTILLNEQYGAGKSSFFNLIESNAESIGLTCFCFRPWLSDSPSSMMRDFLCLMEHKLCLDSPAVSRLVKEYAGLLTGVRTHDVIVSFTSKERSDSLTEKHDSLLQEIKALRHPLLVLIDDVDRLDSHELLTLMKIIRNTADFPYLCYLLAADKASIAQNIGKTEGIVDTDLYLRKFFNLEVSFPPDDDGVKTILIDKLLSILNDYGVTSDESATCIEALTGVESIWDVFTTPRDVYRFVNLFSFSLEILLQTKLFDDVNKLDLLLLTLIQFISQEWYKVLRDRNDKLLDYNHTRGRFFINHNKVKAFYTRAVKEVQKQEQERRIYQTKANDNNNDRAVSLESIIQNARIDPNDALKDVIYKLFGSEADVKDADRICYKNEFFKYFAGRYRVNEVSTAEAFAITESPKEEFVSSIAHLNVEQRNSFIHKLLYYVEEGKYKDRIDLLKKLLIFAEVHFSNAKCSLASLYRKSTVEQVVIGLFITTVPPQSPLSKELKREKESFLQLYSEDTRFQLLSLVLSSIKRQLGLDSFVYGNQFAVDLQEFLINRFINDELSLHPFSKETYSIIPYMREMYPVFWEESFIKYVRSSPEPMAFIYSMIKVDKETSRIVWNQAYIDALVDNGTIPGFQLFARKMVGDNIESSVAADMDTLDVGRSSDLDEEKHPFIKAAMDWYRSKLPKKNDNN